MTPSDTLPSVCPSTPRRTIAVRVRAYLRSLAPEAEIATAALALAVGADRGRLVAILVPMEAAGRVSSRSVDGLELLWRRVAPARGGRPRGAVRDALLASARRLTDSKGGASWREIASGAELQIADDGVAGERVQRGVGARLARNTIKNMVRVGELVEVGREKPAGSHHWHALYAPVETHAEERHDIDETARLGEHLEEVAFFG